MPSYSTDGSSDNSYESDDSSVNSPLTEWDLLDEQPISSRGISPESSSAPTVHESQNAPLVMHSALEALEEDASGSQYGLFGQVINTW